MWAWRLVKRKHNLHLLPTQKYMYKQLFAFFNQSITRIYERLKLLSQKQGEYIWDTRQVKAGTYYYSLKTGGSFKAGKVVIVK